MEKEKRNLVVELAAQMFVEESHEIMAQRGPNAAKAAERCLEAAATFYEVAAKFAGETVGS